VSAPRFGFFFWPWSPAYTARMAELGERHGWDMVGIADTPGNAMDPWVALTLAATRTERVTLAACVTNLSSRHPAITAGAAASVDAISGGRMVLGIGTGHSGVANLGLAGSSDFREGLRFTRALLAGESATLDGATTRLHAPGRRVPVYAAASGPIALRTAGAVADGAFVNYGLKAEHIARARALIGEGAMETGRKPDDGPDIWWIAALDCDESRERALGKLGNILGFVAAYVLGPAPAERGVPAALVPAIREMRATYSTRRQDMDPGLVHKLGLFDYLRGRLAVAGTPDDCIDQVRAALAAGATRLMFTVSLAADPERTVELFGSRVLPAVSRA
jgi:5,10-methylenetetrahydromethanopterin reductase